MRAVISTNLNPWQEANVLAVARSSDLRGTGTITKNFKGFGGCFNELGWKALQYLDQGKRSDVLNALFSSEGLNLNYCRIPIGANDYSEKWYSHNEVEADFGMDHFSIGRDHTYLIPFIEAARKVSTYPLTLFASAWSPPTWMKFPAVYNHGTLVWEERYRKAYALYITRFLEAYSDLGFKISAVHVQNEPDSDQKFPSCCWTGEKLRDFVKDDLGPTFVKAGIGTEIWLGTIERGDFNAWIAPALLDPNARKHIRGVGFQWAGKYSVQRTRQAAPDLPIIQTENECGDGENTWAYAHYVFDLIQHYLSNGAEAYVYWNMVLEPNGPSTWGWKQNSLFTVDPATREFKPNPEYFLLKHFAHFVQPGASVLTATGPWGGNALMFENPDGQNVVVIQNPLQVETRINVSVGASIVELVMPPSSFATICE